MAAPLIKTRVVTNYIRSASSFFLKVNTPNCKDEAMFLLNQSLKFTLFSRNKVSFALSRSSFVAKHGSFTCKLHSDRVTFSQVLQQRMCLPIACLPRKWLDHSNHLFSTSSLSETDLRKEVDSLSEQFIETRELLDDARNSFGSVYFNEDLSEAQESLSNTLERYSKLLEKLSDSQREQVTRTIGLKMGELKAQQDMIMETIRDD